ncbi:sulfate transporter family-domain-containing protein [Choanephora cucurbitarum]|nr:sulfate transporter family-domain-containing protein [Choanephora cucurbitarum]
MPNGPILLDYEPVSYQEGVKKFVYGVPHYFKHYISNLLPIIYWIHRYNLTWLVSDIIAGITVGIVTVPQSRGYAKTANLPPQYGLYSSFIGLCLYCFFGTSKDISIGPTAVMSLLVGQTVARVTASGDYTGSQVAVTLALFGGFIALFIGLVRLGILIDFIPGPAIAGFMTGSCITISIGQWPKLFGMRSVNTHDSAYLVFGHFFQHLPDTHVDVVFGLLGLVWLYGVRWGTAILSKDYPRYEKVFFFANIMRNGVLAIFSTLIAFLIHIGRPSSPISILKTIDVSLLSQVSGTLPSVVIILILEHVAIAKSFGRINNYKIDADQEIIAIGVANAIGTFFGAYPNTGSFSRTAITALSGALVVLLCLYALTPAFYYIPDATLSANIATYFLYIHAVADLVSGPKFLLQLWKINPFELFTFIAAVLITFFTTVEYDIYVSVGLSIAVLLLRIARPRYTILGLIPIQPSTNYYNLSDPHNEKGHVFLESDTDTMNTHNDTHYIYVREDHPSLHHLVQLPPDGVVIFRFDESLTYPNASFISDKIMHYIQDHFISSSPPPQTKGERAWNDRRPLADTREMKPEGPELRAIVLDCSAINHMDSTGLQTLLDLKLAINRFAGYEVECHFANISHPAIRNAFIAGGFGSQAGRGPRTGELLPVVPVYREGPQSVNHEEDHGSETSQQPASLCSHMSFVIHADGKSQIKYYFRPNRGLPIDRYPFFHWDLEDAVRAASYTRQRTSTSL